MTDTQQQPSDEPIDQLEITEREEFEAWTKSRNCNYFLSLNPGVFTAYSDAITQVVYDAWRDSSAPVQPVAWREYAQHLEWCAQCSGMSYAHCGEGTRLHDTANAAPAQADSAPIAQATAAHAEAMTDELRECMDLMSAYEGISRNNFENLMMERIDAIKALLAAAPTPIAPTADAVNWKALHVAADAVSASADVWQGFCTQDAKVCVDAYLAALSEKVTADAQPVAFVGPVVIDRSHPNQAYVTFGFGGVDECTQFIKATRSGSSTGKVTADAVAQAVLSAPVAWMHDDPKRIDVIHAEVKSLLQEASGEDCYLPLRYTIPLYLAAPAEKVTADAVDVRASVLEEAAKVCAAISNGFVSDVNPVRSRERSEGAHECSLAILELKAKK